MSTTTEAPPLTPEEIELVKRALLEARFDIQATLVMARIEDAYDTAQRLLKTLQALQPVCRAVPRLLKEREAANQRIAALEQAAEWRPTHRSNVSDELVRLIEETDEFVKVDSVSTIPADQFYPHFDPIYDPEPYDPTMYPYSE